MFPTALRPFALATALASGACGASGAEPPPPAPGGDARPAVFWHWLGDGVAREGAAKDLRAMAEAGFAEARVASVTMAEVPRTASTMSPEWLDLVAFVSREAASDGVALAFHNGPGWSSSGGPWIAPERSMQRLVASSAPVDGPGETRLPQPPAAEGLYRDVALLALPARDGAEPFPRLADAARRSGAEGVFEFAPPPPDAPAGPAAAAPVDPAAARPGADGALLVAWDRPGRWLLVRVGATSTGARCGPATIPGLECDKLSPRGIETHWDAMPARLLASDRAAGGGAVRCLYIDSWEVGGQNWTDGFLGEFRRRRGYDPAPWLPAAVGWRVGAPGESERFLWDWCRTVADLVAENYYGRFAALCRASGVRSAAQCHGGPFDALRCAGFADEPQGECWTGGAANDALLLPAVSAAHLRGRRVASVEAFTTDAAHGRWLATPASLRREGDRAWAAGANRLVAHSFVHQPFADSVRPGLSLGAHGSHLNRLAPWWGAMRAWSDYAARGQALLQEGRPCAQALLLLGDGSPNRLPAYQIFELRRDGRTFDLCSAADLASLRPGPGGTILADAAPGADAPPSAPYALLWTGADPWLTLGTLRHLRRLAEGGARVTGPRPLGSPSLADDPAAWRAECDALWGGGLVDPVGSPTAALREAGVPPRAAPAAVAGSAPRHAPLVQCRDFEGGGATFFLLDDSGEPFAGDVDFALPPGAPPAARLRAWLYDAGAGTCRPLAARPGPAPGIARAAVDLPPHGSAFVFFRPDGAPLPGPVDPDPAPDAARPGLEIGGWTIVSFEGPGAPAAPLPMPRLASWTESDDPALRFFSGRAVYRAEIPAEALGPWAGRDDVWLDLGDVREVATVSAGGAPPVALWCAPWRLRLGRIDATRPLALEIEVANGWPNRLVGDAATRAAGAGGPRSPRGPWPLWAERGEAPPPGLHTWSNLDAWRASDPLLPAGLLGPVRLLAP